MTMLGLETMRRCLTKDEIILAQSIFADAIDYDQVHIVAHRLVLKGYAISPNGNIYFNPLNYQPDFSKTALSVQSWFIHEMVHVWQYQQGMQVVLRALFNRKYRYQLKSDKLFLAYGIEQQAQMVQDYFLKSNRRESCDALKACLPFNCE